MKIYKKYERINFLLAKSGFQCYSFLCNKQPFPAILSATASVISAVVGFVVALIAAYKEKSLLTVALLACGAVFIVERIMAFAV